MRLTGLELAEASQGVWRDKVPTLVNSIGTDSRIFIDNQAFLALRGPNFDGHEHAAQVAGKAIALIGDAQGVSVWEALKIPQLQVTDTLKALGDIAACHRRQLSNTIVVAITGSYGKTTVRSMLEHVLKQLGLKVAATHANLNNLIGVPQTLLAVEHDVDVALIECGISERGEMGRLSEILQPDVAVLTGLTHAHSEGLGDLLGVSREKAKLFDHLLPQGWCALGHGVSGLLDEVGYHVTQTTYAAEDENAVTWQLAGLNLTLSTATASAPLKLSLPAQHWAENMALVSTIVLRLAKDLQQPWRLKDIAATLVSWKAVEGRMHVYKASANQPFTLIDDCYNANPVSMQAALDTLAALSGHRIAILGDMLELGAAAEQSHIHLNLHDVEEVWCIGDLMPLLQRASAGVGMRKIRCFDDVSACLTWMQDSVYQPEENCTLLLKSSRSMGLDKVVKALLKRGQHAV